MLCKSLKTRVAASVFGVAVVASAYAGTMIGTTTVDLWGRTFNVKIWDVSSDAGAGLIVEPEGMCFYNGILYVSSDAGETNGKLVAYQPGASGDLSAPWTIQMANRANGNFWGPEGLTVNTSGSGFGGFTSGSPLLVTVEAAGGRRAGVIDLNTNPANLLHEQGIISPDCIAYIASRDQFGLIFDPNEVVFLNHTTTQLIPTTERFPVPNETKGMTVISPAMASYLTGQQINSEVFVLCAKFDNNTGDLNRMFMMDFNGNFLGGGQYIFTPAEAPLFGEIESLAFDEANGLLYVADEEAMVVYVVEVGTPPSEEAYFTNLNLNFGQISGGTLDNLRVSDDQIFEITAQAGFNPLRAFTLRGDFSATINGSFTSFKLVQEARSSLAGTRQEILIFNWQTNQFVLLENAPMPTTDTVKEFTNLGPQFANAVTGEVRIRIEHYAPPTAFGIHRWRGDQMILVVQR